MRPEHHLLCIRPSPYLRVTTCLEARCNTLKDSAQRLCEYHTGSIHVTSREICVFISSYARAHSDSTGVETTELVYLQWLRPICTYAIGSGVGVTERTHRHTVSRVKDGPIQTPSIQSTNPPLPDIIKRRGGAYKYIVAC